MYQIVHGAAGLLIGSQLNNPWLAFILGIVSHFILDTIPHDMIEIKKWQDKGNFIKRVMLEAGIDLSLFLILIAGLLYNHLISGNWSIFAGIVGAIIPDYVWGLGELFKIKNKWLEKYKQLHNGDHVLLHKDIYIPLKYGIPVQMIFLITFVLLALIL